VGIFDEKNGEGKSHATVSLKTRLFQKHGKIPSVNGRKCPGTERIAKLGGLFPKFLQTLSCLVASGSWK
jgi:hypothetical protein